MSPLLPDQIAHSIIVKQKLISRNESARNTRDQALRENTQERGSQLGADLVLLVARKRIDDAVDGLRGIVGMERG